MQVSLQEEKRTRTPLSFEELEEEMEEALEDPLEAGREPKCSAFPRFWFSHPAAVCEVEDDISDVDGVSVLL